MKNNRFQKNKISKTTHFKSNNIFKKKIKKNQKTRDLKKQQISKNNKFQKTTNFKKQQIFIGSVSYLPYRFCIISWLIGCPCPFGHNVTTLKISKKNMSGLLAVLAVDLSNNRLLKTTDLKNNRFQKYHILENKIFQKQQQI